MNIYEWAGELFHIYFILNIFELWGSELID